MVWCQVHIYFFLFFFWLCCVACGVSVPHPGIEPRPQQWEPRILTTRQPGNSQAIRELPILLILISSWYLTTSSLYNYLFFLLPFFGLKFIFFCLKYSYLCCLLVSTCMDYLFLFLHLEPMWVLKDEVSLFKACYSCVFFFFFIHLTTLFLLIGDFNPLTLRVIIYR